MLKILILTLNFPKISFSASKFAFFDEKFRTRRFSDSPKFRGVPPATMPLIALKYEAAPPALRGLQCPCPPTVSFSRFRPYKFSRQKFRCVFSDFFYIDTLRFVDVSLFCYRYCCCWWWLVWLQVRFKVRLSATKASGLSPFLHFKVVANRSLLCRYIATESFSVN